VAAGADAIFPEALESKAEFAEFAEAVPVPLLANNTEFGRSPKVTPQTAGREHWPSVFTILMAGAGIPGGRHYGSSDKIGAYPLDHRILPGELAATIYHALGIDSTSKVKTMLERPWQICEDKPVLSLWG